jgi:SAM-dependent methyltransferase
MEKLKPEMSSCPVCGETAVATLWRDLWKSKEIKFYYDFRRCEQCGLHFVQPLPNAEVIKALYSDDYANYRYGNCLRSYPPLKMCLARWRMNGGKNWVTRANRSKAVIAEYLSGRFTSLTLGLPLQLPIDACILDVGCGSGDWLLFMHTLGYSNLLGQDIAGPAKQRLSLHNIPVAVGDLIDLKLQGNHFNLIRMDHVLEHVLDPVAHVQEIQRLLKSDGHLVITVPAIESLIFRISRRKWHALELPRHVYHYKLQTLAKLAELSGLRLRRWRYLPVYRQMVMSFNQSFHPLVRSTLETRFMHLLFSPLYTAITHLFRTGDFLSAEFVKVSANI